MNACVSSKLTAGVDAAEAGSTQSEMSPAAPVDSTLQVSFVIPAHNEESMIGALVESIRGLRVPEHVSVEEVILADAESTDATREIARQAGCRIVAAPCGAASAARNAGAAVARGNVLAFVDADCLLPADWLCQVAEAFAEESVVGMSTPMAAPAPDAGWVARTWFRLTNARTAAGAADWLPSFNFAVRAEPFREAGAFDESLVTCEDVEISHRLKSAGVLRFGAGQPVAHCGASASLGEFMRREAWRSHGALALLKRYWSDPREVLSTLVPLVVSSVLLASVPVLFLTVVLGWPAAFTARASVLAVVLSGPLLLLLLALRQRVAATHLPAAVVLLASYCLARSAGCFLSVSRVQRR